MPATIDLRPDVALLSCVRSTTHGSAYSRRRKMSDDILKSTILRHRSTQPRLPTVHEPRLAWSTPSASLAAVCLACLI